MIRFRCMIIVISLAIFLPAQSQGYLKASGKQIIDDQGNEIILRGMGLGGWMLQEGYMLQINRNGMQHTIKARITDLIGKENCDRFYELWLQNHMTKSDVDSLAKWGFNSIRLPMHYNLFTLPIEDEPVKGSDTWLDKGFQLTDSLLSWCKANKMYLILDLHAAPGGQGKDANISDYDETKPSLWESDLNKQKTVALWRKLAGRYSNEPYIGGYDLINEPNWTFEGKNKNGLEDTGNKPIWDLYYEITNAIREVDTRHIIIIEGNGWGNNYRGLERLWDNNIVLSFHKYWSPNEQNVLGNILELRERFNVPVWLGESGENSDKWFTDCINLVEKNQIGWAWWPLKKINSVVCPLMIVAPPEYSMLTNFWNNNGERPSKELAEKVLFEIAENLKAEKCRFNKDVIDAMFRQRTEDVSLPYSAHKLPGRIYISDFDMGRPGIAYSDREIENIGEEGKRAGNKGRQYRNDGVDIDFSKDDPLFSNGFKVFSAENGEWMQYTVQVKKTGNYSVNIRTSKKGGIVKLVAYKDIPATNDIEPVSATGNLTVPEGGDHWITADIGTIKLRKGKNFLRLLVAEGGFELGYIEFVKVVSL